MRIPSDRMPAPRRPDRLWIALLALVAAWGVLFWSFVGWLAYKLVTHFAG